MRHDRHGILDSVCCAEASVLLTDIA
jgi:hypothetical protein